MPETEPNLLRLRFLGRPMGTLAYRPDGPAHALELEREFVALGHELSPFNLPLDTFARGPRVFRPGDSPFENGLPGVIADLLPNSWGEDMLKLEVPGLNSTLGKLAAIGERGLGAITFEPVLGKGADTETVSANLLELAQNAVAAARCPIPLPSAVHFVLALGGGSLGGIFPKVAAHIPEAGDFLELKSILIGGAVPVGHVPGILKFSRLKARDGGSVEFAFWLMAKNAGIRVPRACLVCDGRRSHFASARFDRYRDSKYTWSRRHVHSLGGLLHRRASHGEIDYREFIRMARVLGGVGEARECLRRVVFNLLSTNRDDHGHNHAFLYNEAERGWTLAPAFDMNPSDIKGLIALAWSGSSQVPARFEQIIKLAEEGGITRCVAKSIYEQVEDATIGGWRAVAKYAGVPQSVIAFWERRMLRQSQSLRADARR